MGPSIRGAQLGLRSSNCPRKSRASRVSSEKSRRQEDSGRVLATRRATAWRSSCCVLTNGVVGISQQPAVDAPDFTPVSFKSDDMWHYWMILFQNVILTNFDLAALTSGLRVLRGFQLVLDLGRPTSRSTNSSSPGGRP